MQEPSFQKAKPSDLNLIKNILKTNELPYEDLETSNVELFLTYKNAKFIGVIGLERFDDTGLLRSMTIEEKYRRKGYGKKICQKLFDYSKNTGIKELYLLTCTAKDFFEKIGFEVISRENVPDSIKSTTEFSELCPCSAICMKYTLKSIKLIY